MSLGVSIALALVVGGFGLLMVFIKIKADAAARQEREDLAQLLKERRPTLEHTLERFSDKK